MLAPTYPIGTERLLLRPPTVADAAAVHVYKSRADVTRFVPHGPLTIEQLIERHERAPARLDAPGQALSLLAHTRDTGQLVGDVVLFWHNDEHRAGEVGYILDPAYEGHGYATEMARAALALGFEQLGSGGLGLHRIVGRIDARNTASARVLERLGMRREAHFVSNEIMHGEWTDEVVYARLEDEWRAASG
jgi:RimJ/RimL family protein N-acetyltransferase